MEQPQKKLIVFGEDWGHLPSSTQLLIQALLNLGWDVIWINSIGMREPSISWSYFSRLLNKIKRFFKSKAKDSSLNLSKKITVIHPMTIPLYSFKSVDRINRFILKQQLSRWLKDKELTQPLIWVSLPTGYPYLKLFNHCPIVYYCCDDFTVFDGVKQKKILELEGLLTNKANLIVVSNPVLTKKFPDNNTYFLDHGVDLALFQTPYPRPIDLPEGKPIAGFYGCLSSWIDIELIYQCATTLKNINFVLIGPKEIDITQLLTLDNVFYLGYKPHSLIPSYSQHWDISLLPFLTIQRTIASNPLTLKEYLSSGKPVVSINLPILELFKDFIYIANTTQDFIDSIELALQDTCEEERKKFIRNYGWDTQVKKFENQLLLLLT